MPVQTRKRKAALEQAAAKAQEEAPENASPKRQKLPVRSKDETATLVTLDDDGSADHATATSAPTGDMAAPNNAPQDHGEESDDDAPPEAVSTVQAASAAMQSARAAQSAAREQAASKKRKRQERDARLKDQARGRRRADGAATAPQPHDDDGLTSTKIEAAGRKRRTDRAQIPTLLPLEFLTDASSSEDEGDTGEADASESRVKQRKVDVIEKRLARLDRPPKDKRIGSTVYRVAARPDERLAPKAKRDSLNRRDQLLKRNRTAVKPRAGFFAST